MRPLRVAVAACLLPCAAHAFGRSVGLRVAGSGRLLHVLEGSMTATDGDDDGEPLTFLPNCKQYADIPCACEHVRFDRAGDERFWPGWTRMWHLESLKRMLTVQPHYRLEDDKMLRFQGPHYWHSDGMGNFKNSMDVMFFVASAYGRHFAHRCAEDPECSLTQMLTMVLNWYITLMQFSLHPVDDQLRPFQPMLEAMGDASVGELWRRAPWTLLLDRPLWAETFLFAADGLENLFSQDGMQPLPATASAQERLERALLRMGVAGVEECAERLRLLHGGEHTYEASTLLVYALETAFGEHCGRDLHPVRRLVLFAGTIRGALPKREAPWPSSDSVAEPVFDDLIGRLCGGGVAHRRVDSAELHFLAADLVRIGASVQLEVLWLATSDDDCAMVGTNFHNVGNAYYSFLHTLPAAHVVHWDCEVRAAGRARAAQAGLRDSATVSFSGFLSVTSCRVPAEVVALLRRGVTELELALEPPSPGGWRPEPLRICAAPRPARRFLSACAATLHGADYIHRLMPHAVEDWINYHALLGVEHFTIFDSDGSYGPYLEHFVQRGLVTYHARFPEQVSPKLGALAAGLDDPKEHRAMLMEPHALDVCVWENRQVSDRVIVVHSFEEYVHSEEAVRDGGAFSITDTLKDWISSVPNLAIVELFQEPMGGPKQPGARSVLSTWTGKRGMKIENAESREGMEMAHNHFQPFAWIIDPLNVVQTAVHFAQARSDDQAIITMPREVMRVNHYVDLGSNESRCLRELGGCDVLDDTIVWAEDVVVAARRGR